MSTLAPDTTLRRGPRAVVRSLGGGAGAVVLHLDTAAYHGLNPVGALIWELLGEGGGSVSEVTARLRDRLPDAPPDVEDDVAAFAEALLARDLLVADPGA